MKSILDPSFRYTSSVNTDLRKTFERHRAIQAAEQRKREQEEAANRTHYPMFNRQKVKP